MLTLLQQRGLLAAEAAQAAAAQAQEQAPPPAAGPDAASGLVISALHFVGVHYRLGGNSPEQGFDCSGFTRHIFEQTLGLVLPRSAREQAQDAALRPVSRDALEPGDLVFFDTLRRAYSHVGIYLGDGRFVHAPRSGARVRVEDMRSGYWSRRYNGARRATAPDAQAAALAPAAEPTPDPPSR